MKNERYYYQVTEYFFLICEIFCFSQKVWGKTAHYLQYDLCKRFADRTDDVIVPYGGKDHVIIGSNKVSRLLA